MQQPDDSSKHVPSVFPTLTHSQYQQLVRPIKRALQQLRLDLDWYLEDISDYNVQQVKTRIKEYNRLLRKLQSGKYASIDEITDIAGMRIVVHGKTDVEAMVALFKGQEIRKDIEILEDACREDDSGYAARHLVIKIRPSYKRSAFDAKIEVQIRTLAEDLFDTLSRTMWYKSGIAPQSRSDDSILTLVRKLREVDEIVDQLRKKWEDAYAQTSADSVMTPHSFRRIVAELFQEEVTVYDAVENVRLLRDRGIMVNKDLRCFFTSPRVQSKLNMLVSLEPNLLGRLPFYMRLIEVALSPKWVEFVIERALKSE